MNALEKLKLTQELKKAIDERNAQTNPLNKLAWVKKVQKLRQELGFIGSVPVQKQADDERTNNDNVSVLSDDEIEQLGQAKVDDTQNMGQGQRKTVVKHWIRENLLGKTVKTIDGKMVYFNSADTVNHISYNVRRNALLVQCVPFIPIIFAKGEFVGRELPNHSRVDKTIQAFHLYRKWVELENGYKIHAEVQACERENEKKLFYAGYNLKALERKKATFDSLPCHEFHHADTVLNNTVLLPKQTNNPPKVASNTATLADLSYLGLHQADNLTLSKVALHETIRATSNNNNIMLDRLQDNVVTYDVEPLRILQVIDKDGQDITKQVLGDIIPDNPS